MAGLSVAKTVVVPLTSDKGLCGGINTTVVKYTKIVDKLAAEDGADACTIHAVTRLLLILIPCLVLSAAIVAGRSMRSVGGVLRRSAASATRAGCGVRQLAIDAR